MSAKAKVVEMPTEKKLKLDPNQWNYKDFLAFTKAMTTNDQLGAYKLAQRIIIEWDYDISLNETNALAMLPLAEGAKVVRSVMESLNQALESMSFNDVAVSFEKAGWNTLSYIEFQKALSSQDYPTIAKMLLEVCTIEGLDPEQTLPLVEGVQMVKAVQDRHRKILSGNF